MDRDAPFCTEPSTLLMGGARGGAPLQPQATCAAAGVELEPDLECGGVAMQSSTTDEPERGAGTCLHALSPKGRVALRASQQSGRGVGVGHKRFETW